MANDDIDLERERRYTEGLFQSTPDTHVPLELAAAMIFHQVHVNTRAIVNRQDYDNALGIAAAALSRLVPIYVLQEAPQAPAPVAVDLTKQHFTRGATELRSEDGTVRRNLSVLRGEMLSAISLIKRAGLPFSFPLPLRPAEERRPSPEPRKTSP